VGLIAEREKTYREGESILIAHPKKGGRYALFWEEPAAFRKRTKHCKRPKSEKKECAVFFTCMLKNWVRDPFLNHNQKRNPNPGAWERRKVTCGMHCWKEVVG